MTECEQYIIEPWRTPRRSVTLAFRAKAIGYCAPQRRRELADLGVFALPVEHPATNDWEWERVVLSARDELSERLIKRGVLNHPRKAPNGKIITIEWMELAK
jgi:hypothetical protein